jgi:hypothetical protein
VWIVGRVADAVKVHLIEVEQEKGEFLVHSLAFFPHSKEIWSLTASPANPALFTTCYNNGTLRFFAFSLTLQ